MFYTKQNENYMYPKEIVVPMKEELTDIGFEELLTPEAVEESLAKGGTNLLFINSVCGCSAGTGRRRRREFLHA